ncbi:UNVERIFIED_CONTAM: hypothetical protein HDU68_012466 [Siphonaria sp. JEL0065]|nr:hypothetical protein HDU68_012466 [Siphonaria sp. JEL0065]
MPAFDIYAFSDPALNVQVAKKLNADIAQKAASIKSSDSVRAPSVTSSTTTKKSQHGPLFFKTSTQSLTTMHI